MRDDEPRISALSPAELPAAEALLARAFRDNPLNRAVIGPDPARRLRANRAGMRALLPGARAHGCVLGAHRGQALVGALVAVPPGGYPLPPPPFALRLRTLLAQGLRVATRWNAVFDRLDRLHPPYAHWYLGLLGVDPERRRSGVGRALLRHWLARAVDREGAPAYLETDRPENLAFYGADGFAVEGELDVYDTPVWRLARPPRLPDARARPRRLPDARAGSQ